MKTPPRRRTDRSLPWRENDCRWPAISDNNVPLMAPVAALDILHAFPMDRPFFYKIFDPTNHLNVAHAMPLDIGDNNGAIWIRHPDAPNELVDHFTVYDVIIPAHATEVIVTLEITVTPDVFGAFSGDNFIAVADFDRKLVDQARLGAGRDPGSPNHCYRVQPISVPTMGDIQLAQTQYFENQSDCRSQNQD